MSKFKLGSERDLEIRLYAKRIQNFELEAGERFTDYFMDSEVFYTSFAFWLLGKGFQERANEQINEINRKGGPRNFSDQALMFDIHTAPLREFEGRMVCWHLDAGQEYDDALQKDYLLWAEFLTSSDRYKEPFDKYLENFEAGNEY
ncbi:hypothetical protein Acj9p012 [Acinetobacter phage Acj9]|uniref:Uncharacterized protein n=1 Tax=Acinetobacter phage Acj9 TaxID=760939 RepID=E5EPE6_9CAUD|nr:hypothetical protein Acj9p012 [Acinetobacter phage Acj9]ADG59912.1 hypothetical protein Acj9p012 [Acinetobacter phage Acj9]